MQKYMLSVKLETDGDYCSTYEDFIYCAALNQYMLTIFYESTHPDIIGDVKNRLLAIRESIPRAQSQDIIDKVKTVMDEAIFELEDTFTVHIMCSNGNQDFEICFDFVETNDATEFNLILSEKEYLELIELQPKFKNNLAEICNSYRFI